MAAHEPTAKDQDDGSLRGADAKGEKPANLPVQQAKKVETMTNLKTAKALWLRQPRSCDWPLPQRGLRDRLGLSPAAWPLCCVDLQAMDFVTDGWVTLDTQSEDDRMTQTIKTWRTEPLAWGRGPHQFEMFLEPTCPYSAKAFAKLDDTLVSRLRNY
jgi:hypothetical protein